MLLRKTKLTPDTENVQQKEEEKQLKLIRRIKPHKGHTLYKVNEKTLEITLVEVEVSTTITWERAVKKDYSVNKKVINKEGFIYISALNVKNVKKILKRDYNINL